MLAEQTPSAVVDTNLIVSAFLSQRGAPHALLEALYQGAFRLVLSASLRQEYADVLARPHLIERYGIDAASVAAFFRFLDRRALLATPLSELAVVVRDLKDMHVLATALGGEADYLVSGDDDLLSLADDPRLAVLHILTVQEFLKLLPE